MPTNPNMVAIQTVTVGAGGASTIEFTNIPQTYTDLQLVISTRSSESGAIGSYGAITFNGSSSNFSYRDVYGNGASATSTSGSTNVIFLYQGNAATASTFGNASIYIPNYTGSTNKSFSIDTVTENNATTAYTGLQAGLWSNTAAITSVSIAPGSGTWVQYSTATLYGVTSAGYGAKATGGAIYQDANYFYHVFSSSGTFTPTQSITADCLVIAGGGGGGGTVGGGGGAGGLLAHTSQSLTAQNYTVTVGGGGSGGTGTNDGTSGSNSQFGSLTASVGGGGGGGYRTPNGKPGLTGGSGGGAGGTDSGSAGAGGTPTSGQGFAGGSGGNIQTSGAFYTAGGGGGAGAAGGNAVNNTSAGTGGAGLNTYSSWASATATGVNGYYAGGGAGCLSVGAATSGGLGGGGNGGSNNPSTAATNGVSNTGSGGGGQRDANGGTGAAGGSGIVIVRYAR